MNNTEKAKLEAARKMLLGRIDIEEVEMLLGVPMAQLIQIKEEIDEKIKEVYGDVDINDIENGTIIFDDFDDAGEDADISEDCEE